MNWKDIAQGKIDIRVVCQLYDQKVKTCPLERGENETKTCQNCYYHKNISRIRERRLKEAQEQEENEKSLAKMRKQNKQSRSRSKEYPSRFDNDYWKRNRFEGSLCLICQRLCKEHGWEFKEKDKGPPNGKQIAVKMMISEIIEQPEMQWMKRFKRNLRTLKRWRHNYYINACKREEPRLEKHQGRPKNSANLAHS